MIAQIERYVEYAKEGQRPLPDLTDAPDVFFAHSVQDALEWARVFPWYANADVQEIGGADGYIITSPWVENNDPYRQIFEHLADAELTRHRLVIRPVNTIYENVSYQTPTKE